MESVSLERLGVEQLATAANANSGRSAITLHGGRTHRLRQTLIALPAGRRLGEHGSPHDATLQVLRGRVRLHAGDDIYEVSAGDIFDIPDPRHDLEAVEDAVVLLTVPVDAHRVQA